jgi:hypothetical protein
MTRKIRPLARRFIASVDEGIWVAIVNPFRMRRSEVLKSNRSLLAVSGRRPSG